MEPLAPTWKPARQLAAKLGESPYRDSASSSSLTPVSFFADVQKIGTSVPASSARVMSASSSATVT